MKPIASMILLGGLFGLASVFSVRPAVAQDDRTTASEVVDRATLKSFVEGAKDYLERITTLTETAKLRDVFRAEGDWKSDSMFLMMLIKGGAVLLHGGDSRIDNKALIDIEDDNGLKVVQELLAAADRGGDFFEYYWDDLAVEGDDNPKVSYTVGYTSGLSGKNLILVGGYYQDVSSVITEILELERPEVTASEVVDRATLEIFVKAATRTFREALLSDDYGELVHVKNTFKVEGGDWKSGSIYVFVVSSEGFVLLHGADLSQEGRTVLDLEDINGVKFVRGLINAAAAGGGFVEYYWGDPAVEGDEDTGSPKLSYAEGFRLPDRDQIFVVGAGIYGGAK